MEKEKQPPKLVFGRVRYIATLRQKGAFLKNITCSPKLFPLSMVAIPKRRRALGRCSVADPLYRPLGYLSWHLSCSTRLESCTASARVACGPHWRPSVGRVTTHGASGFTLFPSDKDPPLFYL